jgi:hypothetical protein
MTFPNPRHSASSGSSINHWFTPHCAALLEPLNRILKISGDNTRQFVWDASPAIAFTTIKDYSVGAPQTTRPHLMPRTRQWEQSSSRTWERDGSRSPTLGRSYSLLRQSIVRSIESCRQYISPSDIFVISLKAGSSLSLLIINPSRSPCPPTQTDSPPIKLATSISYLILQPSFDT